MLIRLPVAFFILIALSACDGVLQNKGCPAYPSGPPKVVMINIIYTPNAIISPPRACARPGDVLRFKLSGNPNVQVAVQGKTAPDAWIKGTGKKEWFYVVVPYGVLPAGVDEKSYNYNVTAAGSPDLDPEVRIRKLQY